MNTEITNRYVTNHPKVSSITIGDPIISGVVDTFRVFIKFMHGDADYYTTEYIDFKDGGAAIRACNFFSRCMDEYPYGMGGDDNYRHLQGYDEFEDYIPMANEYCSGHASPEEIWVEYYDSVGTKFSVNMEFEGNE